MKAALQNEIKYQTSRSSGPGGQHVNKTESKVELYWNLEESQALSDYQRNILRGKLGKKLTSEGVLIMYSQQTRSQIRNKELVTERFQVLIERLLTPPKKRRATKPTRASVERRIKAKKQRSEKKRGRGKPGEE
jgi:ribosome-associated protein